MTLSWIREELSSLNKAHLLRRLPSIESQDGLFARVDGKEAVIFCSNDYLGLSQHPLVKEAFIKEARTGGMGQRASRLVCGHNPLYTELENEISKMKKTSSSLVFPTGYMAALGFVSSFLAREDTVILDKLCHASLLDAARLSGARMRIFPHKNMNYLEKILKKEKGRKLIVTDGLFSMDGDIAPLPEIVELCKRFGAYLLVDDAHATGTVGEGGGGTLSYFRIKVEPFIIQMGTLSKAFGVLGGFIAAEKEIIELLKNKARPFIYTTSLPSPLLAAAVVAARIIKGGKEQRKLLENATFFREGLQRMKLPASSTHIFPIIIGGEKESIEFSNTLLSKGIYTPPIRYPTVKKGEARVRVSITSLHKREHMEKAFSAIEEARKKVGLV